MANRVPKVVDEIDALTSIADWARLDDLINRYFALASAARYLDVWFRLYERFPIDNGDDNKRFWTIMHSLEAQPGFERLVLASVKRKPADFPVMMVGRLLNGGYTSIEGTDLVTVLRFVVSDERCVPEVRESAAQFLARHSKK